MSRGVIPIIELSMNGLGGGVPLTVDPLIGAVLESSSRTDNLLLILHNNGVGDGAVSFQPGANPPAFRSGLGAQQVTLPAGTERAILLESARFVQANGAIWIDFSSGLEATAIAYRLPTVG
ncbi:MAG: hypothetical protein IAE83_00085 [Anaerolinea sp.]|nr:hypothetical protein [Anaerolinea sp.]MCC6972803.1 hypothetical protein [Anaerolineae bacterium]CAG1012730.1 hypothetical protein ANRL4_04724 [Anaerolineae bacterium]